MRNGLDIPLRSIAENAGVDGAVVVNRVKQMKGKNDGYDADKEQYCDLVAAGVIDPAKVVRTALQNAASVAALLLTTESLITEIPKEEEEGGGHHPTITAWEAWEAWAEAWVAWEEWVAWGWAAWGCNDAPHLFAVHQRSSSVRPIGLVPGIAK